MKINLSAFAIYLAISSAGLAAEVSPSLDQIKFEDNALDQCVHAYAKEQGYKTVVDVKEIPCFNRAIRSIKGLEIFTEALVIDLSRNDIHDWTPLYGLQSRLGYIDIHDNPISCADMTTLAQQLRHASRVGFDPALCDGGQAKPTPPPSEPKAPTPRAPSYEAVQAPIAAACGLCHQDGRRKAGVSLNSVEDVKRNARDMLSSIESGYMPPRDLLWAASSDGIAVIAYLKTLVQDAPGQPHRPRHGDDDDDEHQGHGHHGGEHEDD